MKVDMRDLFDKPILADFAEFLQNERLYGRGIPNDWLSSGRTDLVLRNH